MPIDETKFPHAKAKATRMEDGVWSLEIRCPYCKKKHWHGGGSDEEPFGGHRVAHCVNGPPESNKGYWIDV